MSTTAVNLLKVGVVVVVYLFLWIVARAVRAQVAAPKPHTETTRTAGPRAPALVIIAPEAPAGRTMEVRRTLVAGRGDTADFALDDGFASERHARFDNTEGRLWVDDIGSTNGTFVNGERIAQRTPLTAGDTVRIGGTIMEVR